MSALPRHGEPGYSLYERVTIRPALTLNGISGEYQGAGIKTVIPARAPGKDQPAAGAGPGPARDRTTAARAY